MTWFFAVLVVLLMGGIAMVAAGKGTPLAEDEGDAPDSGLPATGPLQAEHLRRVRFPLALRGYRMADVDALLARLADQLPDQPPAEPPTQPPAEGPADPA
jgi:DivIVA domain-containing protein